jgi:hypothetical protein
MICVLTHRRLKPDTFDEFREAWKPGQWWPGMVHAYHLRSVDDPCEVISFAFYDTTIDDYDASRDDPAFLEDEQRRLERISGFEESTRMGGVYEVAEDLTPG